MIVTVNTQMATRKFEIKDSKDLVSLQSELHKLLGEDSSEL